MEYLLTSYQRDIWLQQHLYPERPFYNIGGYAKVMGAIDPDIVKKALDLIIKNNDALRIEIIEKEGQPFQVIQNEMICELPVYDFSIQDNPEEYTYEWMNREFAKPFEICNTQLFQSVLIKAKENLFFWFFKVHHIINDGWGYSLIFQQMIFYYNQLVEEDAVDSVDIYSYTDFIRDHQDYLQSVSYQKDRLYWKEKFQTIPEPLITRTINETGDENRILTSSRKTFVIKRPLYNQIINFSSQTGCSVFHFFLGLLSFYFGRVYTKDEIVIAVPILNRKKVKYKKTVGLFTSQIPLRIKPERWDTFTALMNRIKDELMENYRHQQFPLGDIIRENTTGKDSARNFYELNLSYEKHDYQGRFLNYTTDVNTLYHHSERNAFSMYIREFTENEDVRIDLHYQTDLFDNHFSIENVCGHFEYLIMELMENDNVKLREINIIPIAEKHKLLHLFNDTAAGYPKDKIIHALFEEYAAKIPERMAVVFEERSLTYGELNKKANQLARILRSKGVGPDNLVGLMVERSPEMLLGILGILKAGGCYLPIAPEYPEKRIKYILENSCVRVLLTQDRFFKKIKRASATEETGRRNTPSSFEILSIEDKKYYNGDGTNLEHINTAKNLVYVIYTSGSTGEPKGVMIGHYSLINRINWMQKTYPIGEKDVILQKTPYTFDVSVWELFWWFYGGAKICFLEPGGEKDPALIAGAVEKYHITVMHFVPSMLNAFLAYIESSGEPERLKNLRRVFASGEALNFQLVNRFNKLLNERNHTELYNLYGPTEATVDVTFFNCSSCNPGPVPIGKPIDNIQLYILNPENQLQPVGIPGELYICGDGLARGYINRPELTAEKFIPNPFIQLRVANTQLRVESQSQNQGSLMEENGARSYANQLSNQLVTRNSEPNNYQFMYKTGDMARWREDGNIEYLGRMDYQVKIRGNRIELGEIESRLLKLEAIQEAIVTVHEDEQGNKSLCAYLVTANELTVNELRRQLSLELPDYMIPSYFIQLEKLPLTPNGKIDRKALPQPTRAFADTIITGAPYQAPTTGVETGLAEIWQGVLHVEKVGSGDNFFELGGDSIKAINVISKINKIWGVNIRMKDLYANQTIQKLAPYLYKKDAVSMEAELQEGLKIIEAFKRKILDDERLASLLPGDCEDFYPLSQIQQGMVFFVKLKPDEPIYHDIFPYFIKFADFDIRIFNKALNILARKHAILRTTFSAEQFPEPLQIVHHELLYDVKQEDLSLYTEDEQGQAINQYIKDDLYKKFTLNNDWLWRMRVFKLDVESYCILLSCQHAVLDGWSVAVLHTEILEIYQKLHKGEEYEAEQLRCSYKDYVALNLVSKATPEIKEFWKEVLRDYARNKLPFNISGKKITPISGSITGSKIFRRRLNNELLEALQQKTRTHGFTVKVLCLSAHLYLLSILAAEKDNVTGVVTHDRPALNDSEKVLGCFLNTIPIRLQFEQSPKKHNLCETVRDFLSIVKAHEIFLTDIAEIIGEQRNHGGNPIFDTLFNFTDFYILEKISSTNGPRQSADWNGVESKEMTNTLFDLEISKTVNNFDIQIKYSPNHFFDKDIETAFTLYIRILELFAKEEDAELRIEDLLTAAEKRSIIYDFNRTAVPYPKEKTLHLLFEEQVKRTPGNEALVCGEQVMTYQELNAKSNQLAGLLIEKGIKSGDHVGLIAERSFTMIIGMYAILKSGGAYVPIDPEYPLSRKEYLAGNSKVSCILVDKEYDLNGYSLIKIDDAAINRYPTSDLHLKKDAKDLAYIIYTSGSTGLPKGVMIEHHSAVNLILWVNKTFQISEKDALLFITSMCFDLSVYDIFGILATGGKVVIAQKEQIQDPDELKGVLIKEKITFWDSVPSTMNYLINSIESDGYARARQEDLRVVFMSGDWIPVSLPEKVKKFFPNTRVISLGGATEGAVWSIYYPIETVNEHQNIIPYGRPIDNNYFYILDENMQIVPEGVAGELYIGGVGVARGYMNDPERTAVAFVKNRFLDSPAEMMYKTGDLGRMLPDGNIEFLGRKDHQVKIRGFRVELGEIEHRLSKHPSVKETVVEAKTDGDGNKYLCAYIVPTVSVGKWYAQSPQELRAYLATVLPEYMIPTRFVPLAKLPLTSNGKIDRKALPDPVESADVIQTGAEFEAPGNETEARLVSIWKEILGAGNIGINDNFFEIGGHSLKATVLASRIHKEFDVRLALREIFEAATIAEMAQKIQKAARAHYASIGVAPVREYYPVSSAQKRMYILNQIDGEQTSYNTPGAVMIDGRLDRDRLEAVIGKLAERHESFRTSFEMRDGEPVQKVHDEIFLEMEEIEAGGGMEGPALSRVISGFFRPFDLGKAPLLRVGLIKISELKHLLIYDMHHIISDGISMEILVNEFIRLYNGESLPGLRIQYKDFSEWQNRLFKSEALKEQEKYWVDRFKGEIPVLNLPTDYLRLAEQSFAGEKIEFELDQALTAKLNQLALEHGATLFMVLLAAFNILLSKYTGQEDIIVGSPVSGRRHADLANIIGIFVNTLALWNQPQGKLTFQSFLAAVKENAIKAYENQDYQFEELVEKLDIKRDLSRNPLFDAMFILQNMGQGRGYGDALLQLPESNFFVYPVLNKTAKFDITLEGMETGTGLKFSLEYGTKLFKREKVARMTEHFRNIIDKIVAAPETKLSELEMISEAEKKQLLVEFNDTAAQYPKDKTLSRLFEEQAARTPEKIAVEFGGERQCLTYRELNDKADQLARMLRDKGVKAGCVVALILERSLEMITGIFGVLKAGGAYLPIDPSYPSERIKYMLQDSCTRIILTQSRFSEMYSEDFKNNSGTGICLEIIDLENETRLYASKAFPEVGTIPESSNPFAAVDAGDPAYVIYTSGSTGRPKGVMIEHFSVINRLNWMQRQYSLDENDVILQKTTYTFDVSVWELFWWSLTGAKMFLLEPGAEKDPARIADTIQKHRITTMHFVPSMLNAFIGYLESREDIEGCVGGLKSLRRVFASGEALNAQLVNKFNRLLYKQNQTQLYNLYGPTEATVDVSYYDCSPTSAMDVIPIGKPIDNIKLYVLNKDYQLQPVGVPGELFISGDGLARGYLNNPALTGEKFIPNPFGEVDASQGTRLQRIYKTGDLARWQPEGNIEFLGRMDHQVKIRGYRIELGEIENALLKHVAIKEAVVMDRVDKNGDRYLCAYIVPVNRVNPVETLHATSVADLRAHLLNELPEYMIPSYFMPLEKLPLSPNGKIDRRALPEPEYGETEVDLIAPGNETESILVDIFKEVLGIESFGVNVNFFRTGGDSIKAIQIASRAHKYGLRIELKDLFNNPEIRELAKYIRLKDTGTKAGPEEEKSYSADGKESMETSYDFGEKELSIKELDNVYARIRDIGEHMRLRKIYPLSPTQEGMLFYAVNGTEAGAFFVQLSLALSGDFDLAVFQDSLNLVADRHDIFRTVFIYQELKYPRQAVLKERNIPVRYEDLSGMKDNEKLEYLQDFLVDDRKTEFDLTKGPLVRVNVFKKDEGQYELVWSNHHIIMDGWCQGIVFSELFQIYKALRRKMEPVLKEAFPYSRFIAWLRNQDREEAQAYWKGYLEDYASPALLPRFEPQVVAHAYIPQRHDFVLGDTVTARLVNIGKINNITLNALIQAAWGVLLQKYNNTDDVVFGSVVSGRPAEVEGIESMAGLFINTIPIRVKCDSKTSFMELALRMQEEAMVSLKYSYLFLAEIQAQALLKQELVNHVLAFENFPMEKTIGGMDSKEEYGFTVEKMAYFEQTNYDLNMVIVPDNSLEIRFNYNAGVYDAQVLEAIERRFKEIIERVTQDPHILISEIYRKPLARGGARCDSAAVKGNKVTLNVNYEAFEDEET